MGELNGNIMEKKKGNKLHQAIKRCNIGVVCNCIFLLRIYTDITEKYCYTFSSDALESVVENEP